MADVIYTLTADDVYTAALAYVYEYKEKDKDYSKFFLNFLNALLCEALPYENGIREAAGRTPLITAPLVKDKMEVIPYDERIVRLALPYGVASCYFQDEGDTYLMERYRNLYIEALEALNRAVVTEMDLAY